MNYSPRIYIRGLLPSRYRLFALSGSIGLLGTDVEMQRHLILHAENEGIGEAFLLFSGDEQSGSDQMLLSGEGAGDKLALSLDGDDAAVQLVGSDVEMIRSRIMVAEAGSVPLSSADAFIHRRLDAETGSIDLTGEDVTFTLDTEMLLLSGDEQSGGDALSLSGDEQSGSDALLISATT